MAMSPGGKGIHFMLQTNDESFENSDSFLAACRTQGGDQWAEHSQTMINWWRDQGGQVRSTRTGVMLDRIFDPAPTDLALLTLSTKGTGEIGTLKLERNGLLTRELIDTIQDMGFSGEKKLSYKAEEVSMSHTARVKEAVLLLDEAVNESLREP